MAIKPLTASKIKTAKYNPDTPKENVLRDGQGLELRISPTAKSWAFRYQRPGSAARTNLGFGIYPAVSLEMAREKRTEALALLAQGIDPGIEKRVKKMEAAAAAINTFEALATRVVEKLAAKYTQRHCDQVQARFDNYLIPSLGKLPIATITPPMVIAALEPLAASGKLATLRLCCQHVNKVMTLALNSGLIAYNACAGVSEVFDAPEGEHMKTLGPAEIVELMTTLDAASMDHFSRLAIEFQLHTMARPAEAAGARWSEIDMEARVWTIPATRMKMRRDHVVPLTGSAIAILERAHQLSGKREHVFLAKGKPTKHIYPGTAASVLRRIGFKDRLVAHGFRALASTTLNEVAEFNSDHVEAALAHGDPNKSRSAYNRAQYLAARRNMMQWWSDRIEAARRGELLDPPIWEEMGNVVPLRLKA